MGSRSMTGPFGPLGLDESVTIPRLMTKYNPDSVPSDKVVHVDTIANKSLTYGGLREQAAKCAWGLKHKLGMKEQDRLLVMVPNSVCPPHELRGKVSRLIYPKTDFVILAHATLWLGAVFSYVFKEIEGTSNSQRCSQTSQSSVIGEGHCSCTIACRAQPHCNLSE